MYKIGIFIGNIDEEYQKTVWKGIVDEANEKKVNIICFPGLSLNNKENFEYQANIVYKLASKKIIDGLIILTNTIFTNLKRNEILKFCNNYKSIPVINFGFSIPGFISIKVDSNNGIRELAGHLLKVHKYKKIAFIKGPHFHQEGENRFKVFCNELLKYNINIDNDLIMHGDFSKESGHQAVKNLLDERKKDFDIIVAANDRMAIGAIEFFQSRNIIVPDDIAVVGYDDIEEYRLYTPRLTTIHQPIYEKGRESVSAMIQIIKDGSIKQNKTISSYLVVRQSCGCFLNLENININITSKNGPFYDKFLNLKKTIIQECKAPIGLSKNSFNHQREEEWIVELFETYCNNIKNIDSNNFIVKLNNILKKLLQSGIDIYFWHNLISILRRNTLKFSLHRNELLKAECIWEQARIIIDEEYNSAENIKKIHKDIFSKNMWEIGNFISSAFDKNKLIDEIIECLKKFGINQCFFSLYEKNNSIYPEWSRLLLAIVNGKKVNIGEKGIRYKTDNLIPKKLYPIKIHFPLIIKPYIFVTSSLDLSFLK
jgi:DNA-binding LacI/PurR family transcriptional regulator